MPSECSDEVMKVMVRACYRSERQGLRAAQIITCGVKLDPTEAHPDSAFAAGFTAGVLACAQAIDAEYERQEAAAKAEAA